MNNVIEVLESEHRTIQKVVGVISGLLRDLESGHPLRPALLDEIVAFLRVFSEQCHHAKEEKALFSLLEAKGVPGNGCPLAALRAEHRQAHALLDQVEIASARYKNGNQGDARPVLLRSLSTLAELYPQHIWKEEYLLFPMANKVLSTADYETLSKQFDAIESQIGSDLHHAMEAMVVAMEDRRRHPLPLEDDSAIASECSVCGS